MAKSIFTEEYALFLRHLRNSRKNAGLTQEQVANRLNQTQSFVSKCERGERRIDVVEIRAFCCAMEISFSEFMRQLEVLLKEQIKSN
ncbi:helix-turn-helix domain-containing protein [Tolypothrix sp. NIES-4075]|uniref:helix-turn-helix domain-containing protein n=1 Tax=Tolypothrix sp. NIES-4075 TaxID=2005459 RepID=UPI000B5CEB0E|nr:helix-turn-helix transcriptional regulator [Tolypothrix sp. NIES-4075]GAX43162.1 helix-turn-helix domain-containing protein [Tolypothrix sp. NIES-4075]